MLMPSNFFKENIKNEKGFSMEIEQLSKFLQTNTSKSEDEMCSVSVRSSKFTSEQAPSISNRMDKIKVLFIFY